MLEYLRDYGPYRLQTGPLQTLGITLAQLDQQGVVAPMFTAAGPSRLPADRAQLHGAAAAWAAELGRATGTQGAADKKVAKVLASLGYRLRGERQSEPSHRTVAMWRGEIGMLDADASGADVSIGRTLRAIYVEADATRLDTDFPRLFSLRWPHLVPIPGKPLS